MSEIYADFFERNIRFSYNPEGPDEHNCWTLLKELKRRMGQYLPEFSYFINKFADEDTRVQQIASLFEVHKQDFIRFAQPVPWCIVAFYRGPKVGHVGMVIDPTYKFIHIMKGISVSIERLDNILWENKIEGYYEWINCK